MMKKLIILILLMLMISPIVSAYTVCNSSNISLISGQITDTSFKLFWNISCATYVNIYKNNQLISTSYTLNNTVFSELKSNTLYSMAIENRTCGYILDVTTKMSPTQQTNYYLNALLFFFIAIGLLIIAIVLRSKLIVGLSMIIMGYGFLNNINSAIGYQVNIIYGFGLIILVFFIAVV